MSTFFLPFKCNGGNLSWAHRRRYVFCGQAYSGETQIRGREAEPFARQFLGHRYPDYSFVSQNRVFKNRRHEDTRLCE
jgi:hypothetical protein